LSPNLVPFVCPVCREKPGDYFGHLERPETTGEFCPNHASRDAETGAITDEKVEIVRVVR